MSKEIKNDRTQAELVKIENEEVYYAIQIKFNSRYKDYEGYYLNVGLVNVEIREDNTHIVSDYDDFYYEELLLVKCKRRSENNFNKAIKLAENEIEEVVLELEKTRKEMKYIDDFENRLKDTMNRTKGENKKKEKVEKENKKKLTFNDVVGMGEIKDKLYDVIDQLNNSEKYEEWGIDPIRGMILHGVGGTGKSLISEALAGEIDAHFMKISGADILDKYVGQSGKNVKKIFEDARKYDNCVLMFDECDGLLAKRDNREGGKEQNNVVNEFLYQLASLENQGIFVIATTNRIDIIDDAIKRSGRFDVKIEVPLPDFETRKGILELNAKKKPLGDDVDFEKIARNMSGMNCADCSLLINESARKVLKEKRDKITQSDLEFAFEEMVCGMASKSRKLDEEQKKKIATHEVGHLLANELLNVNKTKKISILGRGNTLGFLLHVNEDKDDVFLHNEENLKNRCKVSLAGRALEELVFGNATTGASNDLEKCTHLIKTMICKYGYSKEMGLLVIDDDDLFMKEKVNNLAKDMLDNLYLETKILLEEHMDLAKILTEELCIREELTAVEVDEIINNFRVLEINN